MKLLFFKINSSKSNNKKNISEIKNQEPINTEEVKTNKRTPVDISTKILNTSESKNTKFKKFDIEKLIFGVVSFLFVVLVVVQVALIEPNVRTLLVVDSRYDGEILKPEEFLYKTGTIELELLSSNFNENIYVLINGEIKTNFSTKSVIIPVKNGDVVEVDGSKYQSPIEVRIKGKSNNILGESINNKFTVNSNIEKIINIKIE